MAQTTPSEAGGPTKQGMGPVLHDLTLILGLPLLLVILLFALFRMQRHRVIGSYEVSGTTDIFQLLSGTWDKPGKPGTCRDDASRIHFSDDHSEMTLTSARRVNDSVIVVGSRPKVYQIREVDRHHIRAVVRGDSVLAATGRPPVWELVLVSPNAYRWRRSDWEAGDYTSRRVRCDLAHGGRAVDPSDTAW